MLQRGLFVGAGSGGLATAMLLAKAGLEAGVIEGQPGAVGRTSAIESEGYRFDLRPTFFPDPQIGEEISTAVGRDENREVPMKRLDPQNLAGFAAFVPRVLGDGGRDKSAVRTESGFDTPICQCVFTTKRGEWERHRLPIKQFVPAFRDRVLPEMPAFVPERITSVGFLISEKQEGPFQLEMA